MVSISNIRASDGTGPAAKATLGTARAISATTLSVDTVSKWPAKFIAATGTPDLTTGLITSATLQVFFGHVSGATLVIDSFAPGYTDKGNSSGDIVILKPTSSLTNEVYGILSVSLADDGTLNNTGTTQTSAAAKTALQADANFRVKPRFSTTTSTATLTPNIDSYNCYGLSAQAAALNIANPTGTPNDYDVILIRIKDNGTSQAITYGTNWANVTGLPSLASTTISKVSTIGAIYSASRTRWEIISITTEV